MDSKKIKWFDASDALLVVRIVKAKNLLNTNNAFPESAIKPFVIAKYADFEFNSSRYIGGADAASWRNPHWGDALSEKENVFVCPYSFNTNLELIIMHDVKGIPLPYAHTFVKFPQYPDANPPKMNRVIKFQRRLTFIESCSDLEQALRKEVYAFDEACRELERCKVSLQQKKAPDGNYGDLVFKICVVSRKSLNQNLRYIENLYPHVPESLHIIIDFDRIRVPKRHLWCDVVICHRSDLVKLSEKELTDTLGIGSKVADDDILDDIDKESNVLDVGSKVKVLRAENESGEQIFSVKHGIISEVHTNGTYTVVDLKTSDSRFVAWSSSALARGYGHFWELRERYFHHQPAVPIESLRLPSKDVVCVKWPAMSCNLISLSHDSSKDGWAKDWPLKLILKTLTRDGKGEFVIGVAYLEPENVVNFTGDTKSVTMKLHAIREEELLELERFSSTGLSRTGEKSVEHAIHTPHIGGEIDVNITAFCPAILLDILARKPETFSKRAMKNLDLSIPNSPRGLPTDLVPSSPSASGSPASIAFDLKKRLDEMGDVTQLKAMLSKLKVQYAALKTREDGRREFFREKIGALEKSKREMGILIDELKTTLRRKELQIKAIEDDNKKALYLAKKTEELERQITDKSSQIDALRAVLAKDGGETNTDGLSIRSFDDGNNGRRGPKARQYNHHKGASRPLDNGGMFSVCCGGGSREDA